MLSPPIQVTDALPDAPLATATLARLAALKAITDRLTRDGIRVNRITQRELNALLKVCFAEHRAELIAEAAESIRTALDHLADERDGVVERIECS